MTVTQPSEDRCLCQAVTQPTRDGRVVFHPVYGGGACLGQHRPICYGEAKMQQPTLPRREYALCRKGSSWFWALIAAGSTSKGDWMTDRCRRRQPGDTSSAFGPRQARGFVGKATAAASWGVVHACGIRGSEFLCLSASAPQGSPGAWPSISGYFPGVQHFNGHLCGLWKLLSGPVVWKGSLLTLLRLVLRLGSCRPGGTTLDNLF